MTRPAEFLVVQQITRYKACRRDPKAGNTVTEAIWTIPENAHYRNCARSTLNLTGQLVASPSLIGDDLSACGATILFRNSHGPAAKVGALSHSR